MGKRSSKYDVKRYDIINYIASPFKLNSTSLFMRKATLIAAFALTALAACKKTTNTTNLLGSPQPAFLVNGISDINLQNDLSTTSSLYLTVAYADSAQENVTLSLSALPTGIAMDTTWINTGIPTFNTQLMIYDTTAAGATPGTYPMVLTATSSNGSKKNYNFNIKVKAAPPCTTNIVGKYYDCYNNCGGGYYADSVYADLNVTNKVWFTNFANSGHLVYGTYSCHTDQMTIPAQTFGAVTYSGSGTAYSHYMSLSINNGSSTCSFTIQ